MRSCHVPFPLRRKEGRAARASRLRQRPPSKTQDAVRLWRYAIVFQGIDFTAGEGSRWALSYAGAMVAGLREMDNLAVLAPDPRPLRRRFLPWRV
jgi:hypothetical protein